VTVWEVIQLVAPYVIPALIAGLAAVLAPALSTARRLRSDLGTDAELISKLPPGARAELRADVSRRAHLLVAVTRHPPLMRNDILAIAGCALGLAFAFALAWNAPTKPGQDDPLSYFLMGGLFSLFIPFSCWQRFYVAWARRAHLRLRYIEKHVDETTAQDTAFSLRMAYIVAFFLPALLQVGVLTYFAHAIGAYLSPERDAVSSWIFGGLLVSLAIVVFTYGLTDLRSPLGIHLLHYHPEFGPELRRQDDAEDLGEHARGRLRRRVAGWWSRRRWARTRGHA